MPTPNNLEKEIEAGLAQAEKMLRIENNLSAIAEIEFNDLPEMAQPIYKSLQENLANENWTEVESLANALKHLAPNFTVADKVIAKSRNEIQRIAEEERQEKMQTIDVNRTKLLQEREKIEEQLTELEKQENELFSEGRKKTKKRKKKKEKNDVLPSWSSVIESVA